MEIIDWVSAVVVLVIAALVSGCSGIRVKSDNGIFLVDEQHETVQTVSRRQPLACLWNDKYCNNNVEVAYGK